MDDEVLLARREGHALVLTLHRPRKVNALSRALAARVMQAIHEADADAAVRAVVVEGAGDNFCAGADLAERAAATAEEKWALSRNLSEINRAILASPKIFYAAIHGWCLGGGLELALACDFRMAATSAKFGWPEVKLGAYPGAGAAVLLPRLVGAQLAKQMLLSARNYSAADALAMGLVDALCDAGAPAQACVQHAASLAHVAPLAQAAIKGTLRDNVALPLAEAFECDGRYRQPLEATNDYAEGIRAFQEKRSPRFEGR